jgi:hypothetical protein
MAVPPCLLALIVKDAISAICIAIPPCLRALIVKEGLCKERRQKQPNPETTETGNSRLISSIKLPKIQPASRLTGRKVSLHGTMRFIHSSPFRIC